MSSIVKVAVVVEVNPQASVAVKITVADPVIPQSSLSATKSLVHIDVLRVVQRERRVPGDHRDDVDTLISQTGRQPGGRFTQPSGAQRSGRSSAVANSTLTTRSARSHRVPSTIDQAPTFQSSLVSTTSPTVLRVGGVEHHPPTAATEPDPPKTPKPHLIINSRNKMFKTQGHAPSSSHSKSLSRLLQLSMQKKNEMKVT